MTTALIALCVVLGILCVLLAVKLLMRGADNLYEQIPPQITAADWQAVAQDFAQGLPPQAPEKPRADPKLKIRLVSNAGRPLGETTIPAKSRRATMQCRVKDAPGESTFVASRPLANGDWEFRRVGVERP